MYPVYDFMIIIIIIDRASLLCDFSREILQDLYETILVGKF